MNPQEKTNRRPLTKAQQEYAIMRLKDALETRIAIATKDLKQPEAYASMTFEQKYTAIATGKAKLFPRQDVSTYANLIDCFTYPELDAKRKENVAAHQKHTEAVEKATKPLRIKFQNAMDILMLSDADKALAVIDDFAAGK